MRRVIIKTGYGCNNRCLFCHSAGLLGIPDLPGEELERRIDEVARAGFDGLVFSGGEPTIRRELPELFARAADQALKTGLISNGRMLAYGKYTRRLLDLGADYFYISLHGPDPETHDGLVGARGAFRQTLAGIHNLAGAPVRLLINCVVVRDNLHRLRDLVSLLAGLPGGVIKFSYVEPRGRILEQPDRIPEPGIAAGAIKDALVFALERGLPRERLAWDGLPFCHLPQWTDRFDDLFTNDIVALREADEGVFPMVDYRNMERPDACRGCTIGDGCRGGYGGMWKRFPETGVRPVIGGASNSFNYEPNGENLAISVSGQCPAQVHISAGLSRPSLRRLFIRKRKHVQVLETDTGDFSDDEIRRILHEDGQVYLDRSGRIMLDDFGAQLTSLRRSDWCRRCGWLDDCGGAWDEVEGDRFTAAEEEVQGVLASLAGVVLDVGCGAGRYGEMFEALLRSGRIERYMAVDPWPGEGVRGLAEAWPRAAAITAAVEDLYLPAGSVDHVLVLRSHNHLDDLWEAYYRLVRAVRPGGSLLVVDNGPFALLRRDGEVMQEIRDMDAPAPEHLRNHRGAEADPLLERFPLELLHRLDIGPTTANQWLRHYRVHHWMK